MSADHKVPFFFFAAVAVACALVLANSVQKGDPTPARPVAAGETSASTEATQVGATRAPRSAEIPADLSDENGQRVLPGPGGMGGGPSSTPGGNTAPPDDIVGVGDIDRTADGLRRLIALVPGMDGSAKAPGEPGQDEEPVDVRPHDGGDGEDGSGGEQTQEPDDPGTPSDTPSEPTSDPSESSDPLDGGGPSSDADADPSGGPTDDPTGSTTGPTGSGSGE